MTDVARACGVSQATVSLVLANAPGTRISAATRAAVLAEAEAIGYRRPRSSPGGRRIIAMLINETSSSPHVAGLIDGVAEAAVEHGYMPMILPTVDDAAAEAAAIDQLAGLPVAGVVYTRLITQAVKPPPELQRWPMVLLNCHATGDPHPTIVPGDLAGGLTATLTLLDLGHRRVAYIGGDPVVEASRERLRGYRRALAMRDVPADPALVVKGGWTIKGGREGLLSMLALPDPPTGVVCFCDRTALGVYAAAAEAGLSIPRDLSVIGYDNEAFAADLTPPLTSMELPHAEMARHAIEELHRLISGQGATSTAPRLKFDCPMIGRQSIGAPRRRTTPASPRTAAR